MGGSTSTPYDDCGAKTTAREVYEKFTDGTVNALQGKTVLVTGGNSGIGLETCKVFAYGGAHVILCSRSVEAGQKAISDEVKALGEGGYVVNNPDIVVKQLDLNSFDSIKRFADDIIATEQRIDYLILNAGIMALPNLEYTADGFEKQIGVNHFGHFYLTSLLREKLEAQTFPSRVVVLSSSAHNMGFPNMDLTDLHFKKGRKYSNWTAYGQSKLANMLFARSLADQFRDSQKPIKVMAVHPGVIQTALWRSTALSGGIGSVVLNWALANKTVPQGAATTVWACLNPYVEKEPYHSEPQTLPDHLMPINGCYLVDCQPTVPSSADGIDESGELRKGLWKATQDQIDEYLQSKVSK